jgi:thioredoxin-like negative regulator of GroEL
MSEVLYLSAADFEIQQGQKGAIMCNKIEGLSLVLFYSTNCQYCKPLLTKFGNVPNGISGCKFGITNLNMNPSIVEMAKTTIDPIKYVPYIILYVDGKPHMRYEGKHEEADIRKFVIDVGSSIQTKKNFYSDISDVSIGRALKGGPDTRRCYLSYDSCYKP